MTRSQRIAHDLLLPAVLLLATASHADIPASIDLAPNELAYLTADPSAHAGVSGQGAVALIQQSGESMTGRIAQTGYDL